MKKIQNRFKLLFMFVIGALCSGITVYAGYQYIANEVSYTSSDKNWKVASVEEALDELYDSCHKDSDKGYGIVRDLSNPTSRWARIGLSEGLEANAQIGTNPVKNDFDNIYPWSDIISYNYNTDTKEITAYYGEDNFTFNPEGNVEVLTKIPEFYYRRYQENGYEYIYISEFPKEGYIKSEEFSVGRYTMSGDATRVHSKSGYLPLTNATITDYRTYARNLGEKFGQMDYHYFILQLLYLVEYADYNSQAKIGLGYTNGAHTAPIKSGSCDFLGMKSGSADGTDNSSIIYRGIEDIFGNIFQFIDGINVKDYQTYVCYDQKQYEVDKYDGCYQRLGYTNINTSGTWSSKLGYDSTHSLIAIPTETKGNGSTYMTDYYWSHAGNQIALSGGCYNTDRNGPASGLWTLSFDSIATRYNLYIGARLLKMN